MNSERSRQGFKFLGCAVSLLFLFTSLVSMMADEAEARVTEKVNCDAGGSIKAALIAATRKAAVGESVRIQVSGTCTEKVKIVADNVLLEDDPNAGGRGRIKGFVTVDGAQQAHIRGLVIFGSEDPSGNGVVAGVVVVNGGFARIEDNSIRDHEFYGVEVWKNSHADIFGNVIKRNGTLENFGCGIGIFWNSSAFTRDNLIEDNGYCGINAGQTSYYRNAFTSDEPEIADVINQTAVDTYVLDCFRGGTCEMRNAETDGDIVVSGRSIFEARNSIITGTVTLFGDSYTSIRTSVTGGGNLDCQWGVNGPGYACGDTFAP